MKTINSRQLKALLNSASNNLFNHYPEVDALNVFPVPDGDTGINMNLTLTSGANEINELPDDSDVYTIAKTFAHGLLMGARGNSGVITSQIFRGFASALEGAKEVDALLLAQAFKAGSDTAYKAVMRPVEGTILTVIRESSVALNKQVKEGMSIEKTFELLLKEANKSLVRTPELLPILKEVGVVDSGGTGLVRIIEGMLLAAKDEFVQRNKDSMESNVMSAAAASIAEEEFGYCTEFIMSLGPDSVKKIFNQKRFTEWLNNHGNSLVVVRDEEIVKVHVHTLTPGEILNYAQQYGEFLKLKIENMTEQHHALENGAKVEAHVDLVNEEVEKEEEDIPEYVDEHNAIIAVSSGSGISQYFKEIGVTLIVSGGQTMNPSSEDFLAAINKLDTDNIFILPNNSNIVMAANQAADLANESGRNVFVIPSKTIPQGIVAALNFDPETDPEENLKNMKLSLKRIKSGEITFSIRDCEIGGLKIAKDDFIGIYEKDIVSGSKDKFECLLDLLDKMVDSDSALLTIFLGDDVKREELFETKKEIERRYPDLNIDIKEGHQNIYSFLIGIE